MGSSYGNEFAGEFTMNKAYKALAATLLGLLLLAGCTTATPALPGGLGADDLIAKAQVAADALVALDYDTFIAQHEDIRQEFIIKNELRATYEPLFDEMGAFEGYAGLDAFPYEDDRGDQYAVVAVVQQFAMAH